MYVFPDGRTQQVSSAVAQVLDTAFGAPSHTNARPVAAAGSAGTPPGRPAGARRETYSPANGDLAVWARGSAVLVVFGTGRDRSYEVIVDGGLQPLSARMGEGPDGFGTFTGFRPLPGAGSATGVAGVPATDGRRPTGASYRGAPVAEARSERARPAGESDLARVVDRVAGKKPGGGGPGTVVNG